jgi:hypothetical protein
MMGKSASKVRVSFQSLYKSTPKSKRTVAGSLTSFTTEEPIKSL